MVAQVPYIVSLSKSANQLIPVTKNRASRIHVHWHWSGVGKCPNWTSPKSWGCNLQQILESDVQNLQNRTFTKPCWWGLIAWNRRPYWLGVIFEPEGLPGLSSNWQPVVHPFVMACHCTNIAAEMRHKTGKIYNRAYKIRTITIIKKHCLEVHRSNFGCCCICACAQAPQNRFYLEKWRIMMSYPAKRATNKETLKPPPVLVL